MEYTFSGTSVYRFVNGTVKCNEKLASLTDITRPLLRDSVEAVNKVYFKFLFFWCENFRCLITRQHYNLKII